MGSGDELCHHRVLSAVEFRRALDAHALDADPEERCLRAFAILTAAGVMSPMMPRAPEIMSTICGLAVRGCPALKGGAGSYSRASCTNSAASRPLSFSSRVRPKS